MGKWTTIMIPKELAEKIRMLSHQENKPQWKIIQEAVSFKLTEKANPRVKEHLSDADKISWYIVKSMTSVTELKLNPTQENYDRLEKTLTQIADRTDLSHSTVQLVLRTARSYLNEKDENKRKKLRMDINSVAKLLVVELMTSTPRHDEEEFI